MSRLGFVKPLMIYLGILACGILIGMLFQQVIFQSTLMKVAGSMDGVEININFNETKMMDSLYSNLREDGFMDFENETEECCNQSGHNDSFYLNDVNNVIGEQHE